MAKKKSNAIPNKIGEFRNKVEDLKQRGYEPIMPYRGTTIPHEVIIPAQQPEMKCDMSAIGGRGMKDSFGMFDGKQSQPKPTPVGVGGDGLGYIPYGPKDNLPNQIFQYANSLPYTAAALKYITDLTVALGPALMYRCVNYVNGTVKEQLIPYEDGGVYLRNRIREVREKIAASNNIDIQSENSEIVPVGNNETKIDDHTIHFNEYRVKRLPEPEEEPIIDSNAPKPGSYEEELMLLEKELKDWTYTNKEYKAFIEENNLEHHYQKCITDDSHLDIYFPTYGLSRGTVGEWKPKIVSIGHLPAVCTRMEQMDTDWRIKHVYFSEKWRQDTTAELESKDMVSYPSLMMDDALKQLRDIVEKNKTTSLRKRPLWFCSPTYYPSMLKPYYPQPAWWSIFPSKVYNYASTLIDDKATARNNATMWGKMIFINLSYLKQLFDQEGITTPEEQEQKKNQIYADVENFLRRRENNGKVLFADSFLTNNDTELWKSIEIVDVPQPSSGADTKAELEEISSIIFFAMGIHPALIGAVPGKSGSTGGTFQRELHLLKQQQVSPRQRIYLKFLQNICAFNGWDSHAQWIIRQQVLTTLDRNANGLEDTEMKM